MADDATPKEHCYVSVTVAAPVGPLTYMADRARIAVGAPVLAPLGSRLVPGVVQRVGVTPPLGVKRFKYVLPIDGAPPWREGYRNFLHKMARYYLAEEGRAPALAFPPVGLLQPKTKKIRLASLTENADVASLPPAQRRAAEILRERGAMPVKELAMAASCGEDAIKRLAASGLAAIREAEARMDEKEAPDVLGEGDASPLNGAQAAAFAALRPRCGAGAGFSVSVIKGVTGSGKTELFFALMEEALKNRPAGQCLLMVPEVSLAAQMIARTKKRFGCEPTVWHHGVSPAERRRAWRRICRGEAKIIVGARSALMLPYADLCAVVVDEEHENAYKQEDGLGYHARDMAVLRASCEGFPVFLASATPSLETIHNVRTGKYGMAALPARFGDAAIPEVRVVAMKGRSKPKSQWLADEVIDAVEAALGRNEQALLFVNRRGYAPLALCAACGCAYECDACSAPAAYHKRRDRLLCHHCGLEKEIPSACPSCGKEGSTAFCGPGVERLAAEAEKLFPNARRLMLSGDATEHMKRVAAGEFDVLIGTQIIAKGLHFPKLTVACVADGDMGLYGADPRARERSFQLIRQVAGRAGREDRAGTVFLQTFDPEHPLFAMLRDPNDEPFVASELAEREAAAMPPFSRMAMVLFSSKEEIEAHKAARRFMDGVDKTKISVLGPAPAPVKKVKYAYRFRLALKAPSAGALSLALAEAVGRYRPQAGVEMRIDRDPVAL
ncbi:MAG: primosomal protein N' [Rickettsiales bacterium]